MTSTNEYEIKSAVWSLTTVLNQSSARHDDQFAN
jgi:hypothetical protein